MFYNKKTIFLPHIITFLYDTIQDKDLLDIFKEVCSVRSGRAATVTIGFFIRAQSHRKQLVVNKKTMNILSPIGLSEPSALGTDQ